MDVVSAPLAHDPVPLEHSTLFQGAAETILPALPGSWFRTCVTSPPYWGLRDYAEENQIGAEPDPALYIQRLTAILDEVRRVLRDDGTLWLNLGDSYTSGNRATRAPDNEEPCAGDGLQGADARGHEAEGSRGDSVDGCLRAQGRGLVLP